MAGCSRRRLLAALAAAPAARSSRADELDAIEVGPGAWLLPGRRGLPDATNLGRVGNVGFVVGRGGVIVVDSGTSRLHGDAILDAIARVTPLPVRLAIVTHARQEFVFGAGAFQARGIPVQMSGAAADLMAQRCEGCLKTLRRDIGEAAMSATALWRPDAVFDRSHVVETIGRPVLVQVHGHASAPGDVSVHDVRSGTLYAGGLVEGRRIPDIVDARLDGWRDALTGLRALHPQTVVPGHGGAGGPELIDAVERYLARLEQTVGALLAAGRALSEVPDAAALPEFEDWDQADTVHRRNASVLFLRLEQRLLLDSPPRR